MEEIKLTNQENDSNKHVAFVDDEIVCHGEECGHAKFAFHAKGCNPIMKLCPLCVAKINADMNGNISIILNKGAYCY